MKIQIILTGPNAADVRCGKWKVPIVWKTPEQKAQAIEAAKIALRLKAELLTKKKRC